MMLLQRHTVPDGIQATRFTDYAIGLFDAAPSRNSLRKAVKRGDFLIDGGRAETGTWVRPGQVIELYDNGRTEVPVYRMKLEVVYEDNFLAVINKPPGIAVSGNRFKTVENSLPYNLAVSSERDAMGNPRPVHRLDSPTGGLLLVAKTKTAQINLGLQFETRSIRKRYRAVVMGHVANGGHIAGDIEGRSAETDYIPVRSAHSLKNGYVTLVDLFPGSGRTHQLRRHMAGLGHPVIGDRLYCREKDLFRGKGLFLSAVEVTFTHPVSMKDVNVKIDEPEKFRTFMEREERRWSVYNTRE